MNYTKELCGFLFEKGYRLVKHPEKQLMILDTEDRFLLMEIISEPLRGQPMKPYGQSYEELGKLVNNLMLRYNKKAEYLSLALFHGRPDQETREEISQYERMWCVDVTSGDILLFENQISDFYGMKNVLEDYLKQLMLEDRKEERQYRKSTFTPVNTGFVIVNILVFLILMIMGDTEDAQFMYEHGALTWDSILISKEYYRLFTSMFLHFGADHLLQNMMMLLILGSRLERIVGKKKYPIIYLGSGLCGAVFSLFFTLAENPYTVSAGASGAIFGVMGGMLCMILRDVMGKQRKNVQEIGMFGILFMIASALYYGFATTGVDNMAHAGGLIGGFILTLLMSVLP